MPWGKNEKRREEIGGLEDSPGKRDGGATDVPTEAFRRHTKVAREGCHEERATKDLNNMTKVTHEEVRYRVYVQSTAGRGNTVTGGHITEVSPPYLLIVSLIQLARKR
ncbi:hypothetical protein EDB83DRAFT_2316624 [Lactarius deliciosus]|nr:hypothetical protein EDB83DRAFT_2316624 [Lactarius deliciosus]